MLKSNSSSKENDDNSDEYYKVYISLTSGDSDISSYCSDFDQEKDDAYCDGSPIETKVDHGENEQTFVHWEKNASLIVRYLMRRETMSWQVCKEFMSNIKNMVVWMILGKFGDGIDTMKSSKEENEDLISSGLKKRKFSYIQILVDYNE
ncbi:SNF2 domain-containing protein CLASSY 4-like [Abeliophyllum distichum]|uniref:SNF2 domain-containing protein CLASSY 4-like n=1 Tax=Abeliophyllum distichum TaxID=126358 RepID=A0ABD1P1B2_9LAMI